MAGKLSGRKGPGGAGQLPDGHKTAVCPAGQESQQPPGLHQKQSGQQEEERDRPLVCSTGDAQRTLRSLVTLVLLATGRTLSC